MIRNPEGDDRMRAQRAYKNSKKTAIADPMHCPRCGMSISKGHLFWCPNWTGMLAGRVK